MTEFCPYISEEDTRCKVEMPKCMNGYEMCSVWYDKFNGIEEEVLGVGAPMIDISQLTKEAYCENYKESQRGI